ncbi:MAG TPA: hypothetical protein VFL62_03500 [Bradyrhizobium sp.]|uniref:DUF6894 family protein n=1 Tax=Bradyrhizobium sp. TaxID=376 RepID=UPI002D7FE995|nr:hypothetical protein [Bradyrhizobium sp.]HET7885272.1 hypothetical protein [Bradyrhizobium sp.]
MPHYHFHIQEDGCLIHDEEGQDFADAASARREAVATGAAIARDAFTTGSADHVIIDVREDDTPVVKVSITLDVEQKVR